MIVSHFPTCLRILVIDDSPDDRLLAIRELEREFKDLEIQEIIDQKDLEDVLNKGNFDLVITDYMLGWSDGITVLCTIKSVFPNCPVIMFTNSGNEEIAVKAMKSGLEDYIIKTPKHFLRLARAVRSVLERVQQRHALEEAENRYRSLFEGVPVGLYRSAVSGQILEVNPALVEMLDYPDRTSLLAVNLLDLYADVAAKQAWQLVIQQDEIVQNFEVQLRCQNGRLIWALHSTRAIRANTGEVIAYEGAIEDITDRKQLLLREQAARTQAEAANRMKDEFLATLSHELRTPLNSIVGWTKMLRTSHLGLEKTQRALETIERNAQAQTKLIEELLDISRIIRGQLRLEIGFCDLSEILSTTLQTMQPAAAAKGITLHAQIDRSASIYQGDSDRLQQIIWNLLSNAIKFTPSGGQVNVELSTIEPPEGKAYIRIRVKDTGIGISREVLPRIFERFSQADSSSTRTYGGLGLGLAIVRHLVELHGGNVFAESPGEGQGTTLTVLLPAVQETLQLTDRKDVDFLPTPENSELLTGVQLLVVDDDPDSREFVATVLEAEGAIITTVASAREALSTLEQQPVDLLLSDIGMPEEDGYDLIRQLRQREVEAGTPPLPAIALTAYARESDREKAIALGFQQHLSKPLDPTELVDLVASLVMQKNDLK